MRLMVEDTEKQKGRVFLAHGTLLTAVSLFWYLVKTLSSTDDDWPAVEWNLWRARGGWGWLTKILGREGSDKRTAGRFHVAVVHAVLLFGSETWVLTPWLEKSLEGFLRQAALRMAGMGPKRQQYGRWVYPPTGVGLAMLGLEEIRLYLSRHYNMVARYVATRHIMDLCLAAERNTGMRLYSKW